MPLALGLVKTAAPSWPWPPTGRSSLLATGSGARLPREAADAARRRRCMIGHVDKQTAERFAEAWSRLERPRC
jgi:hypothetical protein